MSYESIVYRILIASPSDVEEEREIAARLIQDWNDLNSYSKKIVLLPIRWETHTSPTFGIRPQESINKQIVDECDLLIGFFWTKIGTPTGEEISGTIEEIKRVAKAGKPVMLYFSKRGKDPSLIDIPQLELLNSFKKEVFQTALVENYNSTIDFRDKLSRQLEMKIRELQQNKDSNKELLTFSFIDKITGDLIANEINFDIERVEMDESKISKILNEDSRIADKKSECNFAIVSYLNKKNNIPLVLGLKNNTNRILGDLNIELKLKSSIDNSLVVQYISATNNSNFHYRLDEYDLSKENEYNIRKLFNDNYQQTSENTWDFHVTPFNLLPQKMHIIESVILLYPKKSMDIIFTAKIFSDNILQSFESTCKVKINFSRREITDEEINDIIERLPDEDDLPF